MLSSLPVYWRWLLIFLDPVVPPTQVTVAVQPDKLRTGQTGSLTCESASSNPEARLMWIHDGVLIPSTTNSSVAGQYGGVISKASLDLPITASLHGAVITCQATNDIGGQSIHDAVTLEVLCEHEKKKEWKRITNTQKETEKEFDRYLLQ